MKSQDISRICLFVAMVLSCLGHGLAQGCSNWMTPAYSTYATVTADAQKIYTSVSVQGTTNGVCPVGCGCTGVMHTPRVYNKLGSVGGWSGGSSATWNTYISYSKNQTVTAQSGTVYAFQSSGQVVCTAAGLLYSTAIVEEYEAQHANCGKSAGKFLRVFVPAQKQVCNGTSVYTAGLSVFGSAAAQYLTDVLVGTSTDNYLLLNLQGGPSANPLCTNHSGSSNWCYQQNYKTVSHP